jgi:DNA/RNA-binding domain of Phe-tRNA-synthetase-like protein|uniref:B3/B4 tRNA-binding domain-containing protein n=1 Tax=Desulfomonile tiedjei TaxID=2358 RepID=A0A7C4ESY4_9BACT
MLRISPEWKESYPGSQFGVLAMSRVSNPPHHAGLARVKEELQTDLKALFKDRSDLRALEPIKAYQAYYKKFGNTYHVLQQLESVLFKGKSIASVSALVECMFIEELRNMLLTAGHDLAAIEMPLTLDIAKEGDRYTRINGKDQEAKPGDMILRDAAGIISTVIYGPDLRTRITSSTHSVLFTVYGMPGVGKQNVRQHLEGVARNVKIVAPEATIESLEVYGAD